MMIADTMTDASLEELIPAWVDGSLMPVGKLAVHQQGLRHMAVSVFVMDGTRVLIQQRALGKYHTPGLWANTCCTHPRWDEDPAACARRRLREELGIEGLYPAFADRLEYRADVGGGLTEHEVVDVFVARAPAALPLAPNPDEVMATRWVDLYDLSAELRRNPAPFTPWLRIYMTEHMERIFGASLGIGR
jgi:isopentenyl-diphosphate Delta-isomerase